MKKSLLTSMLFFFTPIFFSILFAQSITQAGKNEHNSPAVTLQKFSPEADILAIRLVCDSVASWQLTHPDYPKYRDFTTTDWTSAAFYRGLTNWSNTSGNDRWRNVLRNLGIGSGYQLGDRPFHADDQCIAQTWLDLYFEDQIPSQIQPTENRLLEFARLPLSSLSTASSDEEITWCDGLFMSPPSFAMMTTATGNKKWMEQMETRWWNTTGYLFDASEHLYFRDKSYFSKKEANGKPVFWSRGNGWVMAAMVNIMREMPKEYPGRQRMITLFQLMAEKLVRLQTKDGSWHPSLLDPDAYPVPESSGTAFFTYALIWGVNQGLLPEKPYADAAIEGWKRIVTNVFPSGKLGFIQKPGASPEMTSAESNANYGAGAFLLAGSELLNYLNLKGAKKKLIFAENPIEINRLREVAEFPWEKATSLIDGLTETNVAIRDIQSGQFVPIQLFDQNGDGKVDQLLFLATLLPKQKKAFELIKLSNKQPSQLFSRLTARFVPERKDDFAWENDRMAFRTYGPALAVEGSRGGIDVWSKRTRNRVVDKWYKKGVYHIDEGEGCDGFKVGSGMGCGGSGYLDKEGKITSSPVYASWKLISSGPLRLAFELTYTPLQIGNATITEKRRISMNTGESFFKVSSSYKINGDAKGLKPVAGIRNDNDSEYTSGEPMSRWCAMENLSDGYTGLGFIPSTPTTPHSGQNHLYIVLANDFKTEVSWYAGATWTKALDYQTPVLWNARIEESTKRFSQPIQVTVEN